MVKISRREHEVLGGVLQSLANKEIAKKLNLSERTVKFHVSSLLAKFGVTDRVALGREASIALLPAGQIPIPTLFGYPVRDRERKQRAPRAENPPSPSAPVAKDGQPHSRVFSIFPRERYAT